MPKFSFRLQKVLEYREMEEGWAKDAYLTAQRERADKQAEIMKLIANRSAVVALPANSIESRLHLERVLERIDDEERRHRLVLSVLENDELSAQAEWNLRRQAVKAIERLKENAVEAWKLDEDRREQADLDEWTTMRRVA